MTLKEAADDFLAQKRIAIVGVSRRRNHVTRYLLRKLRTPEREIIPVNPVATELHGLRCYPSIGSIPGGVSAVLVVTKPEAAAEVVRECAALGIKRVWLHRSVGPGSVSEEALQVAREANLTLIPAGCPMMYCKPVDIGHRCFRWCLQIGGRLPETVAA